MSKDRYESDVRPRKLIESLAEGESNLSVIMTYSAPRQTGRLGTVTLVRADSNVEAAVTPYNILRRLVSLIFLSLYLSGQHGYSTRVWSRVFHAKPCS